MRVTAAIGWQGIDGATRLGGNGGWWGKDGEGTMVPVAAVGSTLVRWWRARRRHAELTKRRKKIARGRRHVYSLESSSEDTPSKKSRYCKIKVKQQICLEVRALLTWF